MMSRCASTYLILENNMNVILFDLTIMRQEIHTMKFSGRKINLSIGLEWLNIAEKGDFLGS